MLVEKALHPIDLTHVIDPVRVHLDAAQAGKIRPLLVVMCGPSHCGKSFLAGQISKLNEKIIVISTDEIRISIGANREDYHEDNMWQNYEASRQQAITQGHHVVLDACHITDEARWHAIQGCNNNYRKICIVFKLPYQIVMDRCNSTSRVPATVVDSMWTAFNAKIPNTRMLRREGFDEIYFIDVRNYSVG